MLGVGVTLGPKIIAVVLVAGDHEYVKLNPGGGVGEVADNVNVVDGGVVAQIVLPATPKVFVDKPMVCVGIGITVSVTTLGNVKQP